MRYLSKNGKKRIIKLLRKRYKDNQLTLPPQLLYVKNITDFNVFLDTLFQKSWVVHLQKVTHDHTKNIKYLGRYLKRPPLSETRILKYDGENITYKYHDHHDNANKSMQLKVSDFIGRIIKHIPDKNFRVIRYYNWLSNYHRGKLLPLIYKLINQEPATTKPISWFSMFYNTFGYDPLLCKPCNVIMELIDVLFPTRTCIISSHKELAFIPV